MAQTLLVAGTASHVGKSVVAAGLCRLFARRGFDVAPFKAQNMSNNARVVAGGEIGVSQYVQARAAGVVPTTDTNPVLLKPRGDGESQLVVHGEAVGNFAAGSYYDDHWRTARRAAVESHERLAEQYDVVVAEGAGSIAEINLHDHDLANVETARFADADILLVADIERGGAFASLHGTLSLMPDDVRKRVVGAVVNKFRGDESLLEPGLEEFEELTGVPIVGVLPFEELQFPAEDSVSLPPVGERAVRGVDDASADETVTIAVPRLPRISNSTDFEPLAREFGVRVAYEPPSTDLADADAVVLPGTKNTVDDLQALVDAGFDDALAAFDGPVVGVCGGYQMLGERLTAAGRESTGDVDAVDGFGLLPVETAFAVEKHTETVTVSADGAGPFAGASGSVSGYEIHTGETSIVGDATRIFDGCGVATERVAGTYLHGLFRNATVRNAFLDSVYAHADKHRPGDAGVDTSLDAACDRAADLLEPHLELESVLP